MKVTPCVFAIALFSMATAQTITAQSPAAAGQQPPVELNPTQEVAAEEPQGPSIAVGPAQLRIGGYLGVTGFYRSTSGFTAASIARGLFPLFGIVSLSVGTRVFMLRKRAPPAVGEIKDRHVEYEHGVVSVRAWSRGFAQRAPEIVFT